MAKVYVSPGVYPVERDFSFYVSNVSQSSLGLVGETLRGPALKPIRVTNYAQFRDWFGGHDINLSTSYAAERYFKFGDAATVVRVLGSDSLHQTNEQLIYLTCSGNNVEKIFAVLLTSASTATVTIQSGQTITNSVFGLTANSLYSGSVTLSDSNSPFSLEKLFPRNLSGNAAGKLVTLISLPQGASGMTTWSAHTGFVISTPFVTSGYRNAQTPMIVSDVIPGPVATGRNLFTIYTVSDGRMANNEIKIAIEDIDTTANTFDITVRAISDTDDRQIVLERFTKLSMTKSATTYVARAIGDSVDNSGEFNLISKYIYVSVEPGDHSGLLPAGFGKTVVPALASGARMLPEWPKKTSYDSSISVSRQYLGIDYTRLDRDHIMGGYGSQWDATVATGTNAQKILGFHLNSSAALTEYGTALIGAMTAMSKEQRKFIVPVLGGRSGWRRDEQYRYFLSNTPSTNAATSYKAAIDVLANTEQIDINLLAVPGVAITNTIGTYAIQMCEDRADALYIGDFPDGITSAAQAVSQITSLDSSYAATYWPYVQFYDIDNSSYVWKPPTTHILEAIAYTDSVAEPWFAPAGLNRGLLSTVSNVKYKLTVAERDTLYNGRINPIATFTTQGIVAWGQKTLQVRSTALDRINVRRMILFAKKIIAGATKYLVFEQNDVETWDRFKALVNPVLDTIRQKRGIVDFRVVMDETTNTADVIDRNEMIGYLYIKPTKSAEIITINFTLMPQGATFED